MNIIVFGASQVYGSADWKHGGWVARLKSHIEKRSDFDDMLYNLGISGETSSDILKRFESELKPRLDKNGQNLIIFSVGINDSQYLHGNKNNRRTTEKDYRKNVAKLVRLAKKYTCKVCFVGIILVDDSRVQPIPWSITKSYACDIMQQYNRIAKDVCKKERVPFLDLFEIFSKLHYKKLLDDGLHPNIRGHEKIFENVLKFLEKNSIIARSSR